MNKKLLLSVLILGFCLPLYSQNKLYENPVSVYGYDNKLLAVIDTIGNVSYTNNATSDIVINALLIRSVKSDNDKDNEIQILKEAINGLLLKQNIIIQKLNDISQVYKPIEYKSYITNTVDIVLTNSIYQQAKEQPFKYLGWFRR